MSKDIKPKRRLGQTESSRRKQIILGAVSLLLLGTVGSYAYNKYKATIKVEIPVEKVRQGDFVIAVRSRGEIRSVSSEIVAAPQVPNLRIVRLAPTGRPIKKGDIVVEFDGAQQEQTYLEKATGIKTADSEIAQTRAEHRITNEMDSMDLMKSQYNVQRAELEASKAEVVSAIEGAKNRIDVGVSEGNLGQVKTTIGAHGTMQRADLDRLAQKKTKVVRDANRTQGYLQRMVLRAPIDGIVNILPNFRSQGSFGSAPPPFKEGDDAWTGAPIAEIPDLSQMRIELQLDEVDRGRLKVGQPVRIKVDAIPDREFQATLDWISPIAEVVWKGMGLTQKLFPSHATLKKTDPRLRPGMSASADIILESVPNAVLIPLRASFSDKGHPAVYVQKGDQFRLRQIEVGRKNDSDIVVTKGLEAGETVALENPIEAAKKAKKL